MGLRIRTKQRVEYGDFQTPLSLAKRVCRAVCCESPTPAALVEPTCGRGSFLVAALECFPSLTQLIGVEINPEYAEAARSAIGKRRSKPVIEVKCEDFFGIDWQSRLRRLPDPLLVIGNPPWVTSGAVGSLNGTNLPKKSNLYNYAGLDAVTGKSNFDISEWMLIRLLEGLQNRKATLAMLCKTAVARKVLLHGWKHGFISRAALRLIDAAKHFDASVDACLLICTTGQESVCLRADIYSTLEESLPRHRIGYRDGQLIPDLAAYEATCHLAGESPQRWRSGIKHDCARVMEFIRVGDRFQNGFGELVSLEEEYLYPLLKSSDLAGNRQHSRHRWMLVTQPAIGEDTKPIKHRAPMTWKYLERYGSQLDRRASSIYRDRPRFSIFGVGNYAFAPHRIATSGLYKQIQFSRVPPLGSKPTVLDDTCSFLPCQNEGEAEFIAGLLESDLARTFYKSRIFWDAKRPLTVAILNQLNIRTLADQLAPQHPVASRWHREAADKTSPQLSLF